VQHRRRHVSIVLTASIAKNKTKVVAGRMTDQEARIEFLHMFDDNVDGTVTIAEFEVWALSSWQRFHH
jgi:hypothetical protein